MSATPSRAILQALLQQCLHAMWLIDTNAVIDTAYLLCGAVADPWEGCETGVGEEVVLMAAARVVLQRYAAAAAAAAAVVPGTASVASTTATSAAGGAVR